MYFDAVLNVNRQPLYNGTREEIVEWLNNHPETEYLEVADGETLKVMSVREYLGLGEN